MGPEVASQVCPTLAASAEDCDPKGSNINTWDLTQGKGFTQADMTRRCRVAECAWPNDRPTAGRWSAAPRLQHALLRSRRSTTHRRIRAAVRCPPRWLKPAQTGLHLLLGPRPRRRRRPHDRPLSVGRAALRNAHRPRTARYRRP